MALMLFSESEAVHPSTTYSRVSEVNYKAPYSGTYYIYSGQDNYTYKRFMTTIDLTTANVSAYLDFYILFETEQGYDFVIVEAHTVG